MIDDGPEEEFSGVFTDIFPAEWAADPDFCQYLTQLRKVSVDKRIKCSTIKCYGIPWQLSVNGII